MKRDSKKNVSVDDDETASVPDYGILDGLANVQRSGGYYE
jgi:hypothetical protein